jgi:3-phosphoshikimate 1-carboxyvinyltransferase
MALSVILTLVGGEIEGAEAVSKSYPDFFSVIKELGIKVNSDEFFKGQ